MDLDRLMNQPGATGSADSSPVPFFSVVIPVFNGGSAFRRCLSALESSSFRDWELVVVDDGSSDGSGQVALAVADKVLSTSGREGPAAARNLGARSAIGNYLFFLDADCSMHNDTLALAAARFRADPELEALFGSYDDRPTATSLVARFKNLQHHHVHQQGDENAQTFWAGCGSIRRTTFLQMSGFDAERFERPCVEDIELGYRLKADQRRILLAKEVQVTHHKAWTLCSLIRTDLFDRGIPWVVLMSQKRASRSELNIASRGRLSVLLGVLVLVGVVLSIFDIRLLALSFLAGVGILVLNLSFYRLLLARGGVRLLVTGLALHWVYQLVCALSFLFGKVESLRRGGHESQV